MDAADAEIAGAEEEAAVAEEKFSFKEDTDKILQFILTDDWENVLVALTKDMDPWDVDLVTLSERFTSYLATLHRRDLQLRESQSRGGITAEQGYSCSDAGRERNKSERPDLRAPSRVILAAAIIYRLKSETLSESGEEPEAVEEAIIEEERDIGEPLVLPPIEVPLKREPRRKVTVRELVNALGKAMKVKNRREARRFFSIDIKGVDITKKIEEIYGAIIAILERTRNEAITFTSLFSGKEKAPTPEEKLLHFNSILHLSTQERIVCTQNTLFGEIYIAKP